MAFRFLRGYRNTDAKAFWEDFEATARDTALAGGLGAGAVGLEHAASQKRDTANTGSKPLYEESSPYSSKTLDPRVMGALEEQSTSAGHDSGVHSKPTRTQSQAAASIMAIGTASDSNKPLLPPRTLSKSRDDLNDRRRRDEPFSAAQQYVDSERHKFSEYTNSRVNSFAKNDGGSSNRSSRQNRVSGTSLLSNRSYYSAPSGRGSYVRADINILEEKDEYAQLLQSEGLWPVAPMVEQNWSGRGQHAKFEKHEKKELNEILEFQEVLGNTATAIVQSVKCRRILLARKTIQCRRAVTKAWAIKEVAHLTRLNHSHIVRVIGTYTMGRELSILMYPVTEYNLETFLDAINTKSVPDTTWIEMIQSCQSFFGCLSGALHHIHTNITKHKDIKPSNILVRHVGQTGNRWSQAFKVYIADFGISRTYSDVDAAETEGPTSFTRKYASPEVTNGEPRGFPADIFSLGCVFIEMISTLNDARKFKYFGSRSKSSTNSSVSTDPDDSSYDKLQRLLKANVVGDTSYQANIDTAVAFWSRLTLDTTIWTSFDKTIEFIPHILSKDPLRRPTAQYLTIRFGSLSCCKAQSEELALQAQT